METEMKSVIDAIRASVGGIETKFGARFTELGEATRKVQAQVDCLDLKMQSAAAGNMYSSGDSNLSAGQMLLKHLEGEPLDRLKQSGRLILEIPSSILSRKATITTSGNVTPYPLAGGIVPGGRWPYRLRSVFRTEPIEAASAWILRENAYVSNASPVSEASAKTESTFTFTAKTIPVETLAHYVNCSKQALDDLTGLAIYLDNSLIWGLEKEIEAQIISGDAATPNLEGLTPTATAFDTSYLPAASDGYEYVQVLHSALTQLRVAGFICDTFVVSPADWAKMETLRDSTGQFVMGSPRGLLLESAWGAQVVVSPELTSPTFIALDSRWFHIRLRQTTVVEISFEHSDNWTKNLATIRAECRLAFVQQRPSAAVTGSLVQSPA